MNPVECSAGELFCPQPDTRFLVEYVRRDYAMVARTERVNRHLNSMQKISDKLYNYIILHNPGGKGTAGMAMAILIFVKPDILPDLRVTRPRGLLYTCTQQPHI